MKFLPLVPVEIDHDSPQKKYYWLERWLEKNDSLVSETYSYS